MSFKPVLDTRDEKNEASLIDEALKRFRWAETNEKNERAEGVDDLKFFAGNQWPDRIRAEREAARRPTEVLNRIPALADITLGEMRQNKIAIKVKPYGNQGSKEIADLYEGLIRNIESVSNSEYIYQDAAQGSVISGRGCLEIIADYIDDDVFDQELRIKKIKNPYTVYFDPTAEEHDKRDGNWAFIIEDILREDFSVRFPDKQPSQWGSSIGDNNSWNTQDTVRIAKYFVKRPKKKIVVLLSDHRVVEKEEWEKIVDDLKEDEKTFHADKDGNIIEGESPDGEREIKTREVPTILREREVDSYKIEQYLIDGTQILEGPKIWPGKYIPIIPIWGKTMNIEGKDFVKGLTRDAKGPSRLNNYARNSEIERNYLAKIPPIMATPEQMKGHLQRWNSEENFKVGLYNHVAGQPMPSQTQPPQASSGNIQQSMQAGEEIKAAMSTFDASTGAASNEVSGVAINARKVQGNIANFAYQDNKERAVKFCGEILVDVIPYCYDNERQIMIFGEDESETSVTINQIERDEDTGKDVIINDLSQGKYLVKTTVGPHFNTQREETASALTQLARFVPIVGQIGADILVSNLDFNASDELAERIKRTIPPNITGEEEEQQGQGQDQQPTPEQQAVQAAAAAQQAAAQAEQQVQQAKVQQEQLKVKKLELEVREQELEVQEKDIEVKGKQFELQAKSQGLKEQFKAVAQSAQEATARQILGVPQQPPQGGVQQ